ncbi:hypothetical protein LX32DRAFT_614454 [Colletotrichum zoysiae]|uniref:Uncharacterized protein n=1 Tax=Colletotrichum zoysiae TaxID=1216348 RepID=A0AAD9HN57_9PEZI|nr:hypothetical protein LX32DRAFT_614454 [Colletotrichum zoysiae]
MSGTLTVPQRLAFRKWVHSFDDVTPTLPRAAEWLKGQFGKEVSEAVIRLILNHVSLQKSIWNRQYCDVYNFSFDLDRTYHDYVMEYSFYPFDDGVIGPLIRPGFGRNLRATTPRSFPNATQDWSASTLTYLELAMLWFIEHITNKPDWHVKVFNQDIVSKWKTEVMAVDWRAVDLEYAHFNDAMFAWCLAELREKATLYEATGLVPVYDVTTAVVKADNVVPPEVKDELKRGVEILEDVQQHAKDWHPGSDGKVLDLVHPSLYPLVYGVSRIVPDKRISLQDSIKVCGTGQTIPAHAPEIGYERRYKRNQGLFSYKFQWLPCEIDIQDGKPAITSYINNLHPKHHAGLYATIEKVIEKSLPLWDVIYRWHKDFELLRIRCKEVGVDCQVGCTYFCSQENRPLEPDEDERNMDEYWDERRKNQPSLTWQRDKIWFERTHPIKMPSVPEYCPMRLQPKDVNLEGGFLDDADRIQVIVKLANIQLTPEKPTYDGGSWHIEGQLHEHICATALYYYDNENVTESRLAFRTNANKERFLHSGQTGLIYEHNDFDSLDRTFKIDSRGSITQDLGSVLTREDRLLAFPNVYEHRVAPFELVDKTKPGHRKILALFLIDPAVPIISTANVPPQQCGWWEEGWMPDSPLAPLPSELTNMVFDHLDFPISLEKAKKIREELMAERTGTNSREVSDHRTDYWTFCEH